MAITIKQLHKVSSIRSDEHNDRINEATLYFRVLGTRDEATAIAAMRADTTNVPTSYGGCLLDSFRVSDWMGVNGFEVEAIYKRNYGVGISSEIPNETEEFHGSLQTIHIAYSNSYRTKGIDDDSESTVGFGHQIEPTEDGVNAVGCDGFAVVGQLIIKHCFSSLSRSDEIAIENLLGHVNTNEFRGRAAGSLLFANFDKVPYGNAYVECTYTFAYMPNGTAKFRGDNGEISITKKGWEYAWAKYQAVNVGQSNEGYHVIYACAEDVVKGHAAFNNTTLKISAS